MLRVIFLKYFLCQISDWLQNDKKQDKILPDRHTSITDSICYNVNANAAAKWRLAGVARGKLSCLVQQEEEGEGTGTWHMTDGLSIASEACWDLWQGPAGGAWPPKLRAHWSICYLHPKWMRHSCGGSQWGRRRKEPDAVCHCFLWWWAVPVSSLRNVVNHEGAH